MIDVPINNCQRQLAIDADRIQRAVRAVLQDHEFRAGEVSVAVVDDPAIRRLNAQHLQHDYATDVLSFLLETSDGLLEGEIIVSGDTARRTAPQYGWSADDELLLYVIHGALHLVGYDDDCDAARERMRGQEVHYLRKAGSDPPARLLKAGPVPPNSL